jgi:hypothetical protein
MATSKFYLSFSANQAGITIIVMVLLLVTTLIPLETARTQTSGDVFLPLLYKEGNDLADIHGKAYDNTDPNATGIAGVEVCINNVGLCVTTDTNGEYRINDLRAGPTTITATFPGFDDYINTVFLTPGEDNIIDIPLNTVIDLEGEYRIVLSWKSSIDGKSVDLDANFWTPEDNPYHVANVTFPACEFVQGVGSLDTHPFVLLDIDSVDGRRPETIYVKQLYAGNSTYAVLNYSLASGALREINFPKTGAKVEIYDINGLAASFTVPLSDPNQATWWKVFVISDTGDIEVVNTLSTELPVDYLLSCR